MKELRIKVVAFDADDTLWDNEIYFQEAENKFVHLLQEYLPPSKVSEELLQTEISNIPDYGYGIKAFMLSMIETALRISKGLIDPMKINSIIGFGKEIFNKPVVLVEGVTEVLESLNGSYRLVMATKGYLMDQQRKLEKSGIEKYFHHIEIMTEKNTDNYRHLIGHLDIESHEFMMVGNSLKSDVLPVLDAGGHAIYVPHEITWLHEKIDTHVDHPNFFRTETLSGVISILYNA